MDLPQAARWKAASDKEIASLGSHGVHELVSITAVKAGQRVVGPGREQLRNKLKETALGPFRDNGHGRRVEGDRYKRNP